ncbi:MAG TPA: rhodanese-like domain-containing protein [Gemmatimonadaceae bacterium]|nr:rhodanese-like domain-containing protein [Gemmatimonadaceae bacterium]
MRRFSSLLAATIAASLGSGRPAAAQRDQILVNTAWLAKHLQDPNLVLLHVGSSGEYGAMHIPGARFVDLDDISVSEHTQEGLMLEMPTAESLRERLQKLGISNDSRIIVYYGTDWVSPSTRVIFTLDYAGLGARTSLLDGGMPAWIREGNKVTDKTTPPRVGTLAPLHIKPIVVDAAYVKEHIGKPRVSIVDGRDASFYDGVQQGNTHMAPHRAGHIAGAKSVPFTEITYDNLLLKSPNELTALFTKAGVQPGDTIVGYCHIGQQATAMLFAARSLGHPVLLYDGSFQEWSRLTPAESYPVENPSAKGKQ